MSRLVLPFDTGAIAWPARPPLLLNAAPDHGLGPVVAVQDARPVYDRLPDPKAADAEAVGDGFQIGAVTLTRHRHRNRALVATAWAAVAAGGFIVVSGAKTDGIEPLIKDMRRTLGVEGVLSKAHGKVAWIPRGTATPPALEDWRAAGALSANQDGFVTAPGMFSHDRIDPGSRLLAGTLPARIGPRVADLGAGWGFLSRAILTNDRVRSLDMVEASHLACRAAQANVRDPRAAVHWADAAAWAPAAPYDTVVTNPPFHDGRAADPSLGQAFIAAAARMLTPSGKLFLVANRHLPYESALFTAFRRVDVLAQADGFKVCVGDGPRRARR